MTLATDDLKAIRDEIDEALEDKLDDAMGDVRELAAQVEWMRRDLESYDLKRQSKAMSSLCEGFLELRETVKKLASR